MNLILFSPEELDLPLNQQDQRALHILNILRVQCGRSFDVGQVNGPLGKATLQKVKDGNLYFSFEWQEEIPDLFPIDLWVSYCRPQSCRKILQECTSLGVKSITFFDTQKCEPSYKESRLWSTCEAERLLIRGAEQAFCTQVPQLNLMSQLADVISKNPDNGTRIALDNYEATFGLGESITLKTPITLAVGGERGWSEREREALRNNGFKLAHLGFRVLRTETACIAAISILRSQIQQRISGP